MTFEDYKKEVARRWPLERNWRFGQTCFNVLAELNPELADKVRGTSTDPFYILDSELLSKRSDKIDVFLKFVEGNWKL